MTETIAFIDLSAQQRRLGDALASAINRVLEHGQYIMGPEVAELESRLSDFCGVRNTIACANGTDALQLVLMAWGVGPGDAVFMPAFTFIAPAEATVLIGATPVFVDVDHDTFNLDPVSLEAAIASAEKLGLRPKVVIPTDLFGQPAAHPVIGDVAARHALLVLDDAAQGFGGRLGNRTVGSFGHAATTSFFPAKPLGCYGDGGAVFTNDDGLAELLRSIRMHGKGSGKYDNVRVGLNSRLDTLQASILLEKLKVFPEELEARQVVAARYTEALADIISTPKLLAGAYSTWAQYTVLVEDRLTFLAECKKDGIPVQIYYPTPLHQQPGYIQYPCAPGGCPVSEDLACKAVSLPMHPYLSTEDQMRVISAVRRAAGLRKRLPA